jgi:3-oxoacyl-[acyl-carrier-protein] synthase-1
MIYIGAENIISPLGKTIQDNFLKLVSHQSGVQEIASVGRNEETCYLGKIVDQPLSFATLMVEGIQGAIGGIDATILTSPKTILLISSTKGDIAINIRDQFNEASAYVRRKFGLVHQPIVVSNACISGVLAMNMAERFIASQYYDHAIVVGCDLISNFVINGFQSLFAMSGQRCKPFDAARTGINLGEGCGVVVVSKNASIFEQTPLRLLKGHSANDANHISGPSRTGEGLFRTVRKTMEINGIMPDEIDFISAHGTATIFNDEMEAIAFDRLNISHRPINSLKGYFGHTLGAAGVIETAVSMQMMRNNLLLKSMGYASMGTSKPLHIIEENKFANLKLILKTASGFGGGNASLAICKE